MQISSMKQKIKIFLNVTFLINIFITDVSYSNGFWTIYCYLIFWMQKNKPRKLKEDEKKIH